MSTIAEILAGTPGPIPTSDAAAVIRALETTGAAGVAGTPAGSVQSVQGVTNGTPVAGSVADGADVTIGALADAVVAAGAAGSVSAKLRRLTTDLAALLAANHTDLTAATPAGTNTIGYTRAAQYTGVPSSFAFQTADQTVFTLAAGEVGFIQNCDDAALAVKKGASASPTSLSMILKACATADDGSGGYVVIKDWVGAVSVAAMAGTARYLAWKQAP